MKLQTHKMIAVSVASTVIAIGLFSYAEMLYPEAAAVVGVKALCMLAVFPLALGFCLGLLPRRLLRFGILPWMIALVSAGANWIFFKKTWLSFPGRPTASIFGFFLVLGILMHLGSRSVMSPRGERSPNQASEPTA